MKVLNPLIFLMNVVVAFLLLCAYASEHVFIRSLAVISLATPLLILCNLLFCLYWVIRMRMLFLISLIVLGLGFSHFQRFYKFSSNRIDTLPENKVSIMSYNVRLFNAFGWIKDSSTDENLITFIKGQNPDILCIQEFYADKNNSFNDKYPYRYIYYKKKGLKMGQGIFSKFPIVKTGSIPFPESYNNCIFADIKLFGKTVRVFNVHLQSLRMDESYPFFDEDKSKKLAKKLSITFTKQKQQTDLILDSFSTFHHPAIVCGDFNNTACSYIYGKFTDTLKDAFVEAGKGFSSTFLYTGIPIRIDYTLVDKSFDVSSYKTFKVNYSDHSPIMSEIYMK